jgi:hypothetical protein
MVDEKVTNLWTQWIGRKIFVRLSSGKVYNGIVEDVQYMGDDLSNHNFYFITIIDKFDNTVGFTTRDISEIKEEGYKNGDGRRG